MNPGFSFVRARSLFLAGGLLVGMLVGCNGSERYPTHLRYPARTDLLVNNPDPDLQVDALPPPGQLEESIAQAEKRYGEKRYPTVDPAAPWKGQTGDSQEKEARYREERTELNVALAELFGTPAAPTFEPIDPVMTVSRYQEVAAENRKLYEESLAAELADNEVTLEDIDALVLDSAALAKGDPVPHWIVLRRGSELYRKHCLHCHGLSGDGRGPTGPWVHPHPRDYRQGLFKFRSTNPTVSSGKPRKSDLYRTLERGIDGTSMPAFGLLPRQELEYLVSYVIHLSIRGQVEYEVLWSLARNESRLPEGEGRVRRYAYQLAARYLAQWAQATKREANKPPEYPAQYEDPAELAKSIRNGHQLFLDKAGCMKCHHDYGRQAALRYDKWGTVVRPRDLTTTNYRGGRTPVDLYWRIAVGIDPSNMPALTAGTLKDSEYWDLVNFVQHLPYPGMIRKLTPELYQSIYEQTEARKAPPVAQAGH